MQQGAYGPPRRATSSVAYADPSDLAKMLDLKTGHFPLNAVRDAMGMFYLE